MRSSLFRDHTQPKMIVTDVSGRPVCLDCLTLEDGTDMLSRSVGDYQCTLCNIQQELRSRSIYLVWRWEVSVPCAAVHKQLTRLLAKRGPLRASASLLQYVIPPRRRRHYVIIVHQELGLNRPVSASFTSLFSPPCRRHPFGQ